MARDTSGDIARQMAATPLHEQDDHELPDERQVEPEPEAPARRAAKPRNPKGEAGQDMRTAITRSAIRSSERSAAKLAEALKGQNPFAQVFGPPVFSLGERKEYQSKDYKGNVIPNKTNSRLAHVTLKLCGLTISASIYRDRVITKDAEGTWEDCVTSFSMPKAFVAPKDDPVTAMLWDQFKNSIFDQYQAWILTVDSSVPVMQKQKTASESTRTKIADPAPQLAAAR